MDRKSSPEPGTGTSDPDLTATNDDNTPLMAAAAVVQPAPPNKRYRPAPAKTFQCRGYGDCRMVFSRSEHLARHIRKHTGERPFMCHCSKQFSRLDNLRQHAQTVHADKQEQNERMMRDLTSLHASMAAANKISNARNGRRVQPPPTPAAPPPNEDTDDRTSTPMDVVKQEDLAPISYDSPELYQQPQTWQNEIDTPKYFQPNLSFSATGSRPSTSERLPPLSSIVSASIPQQQQQQQQQQQSYASSFPAHLRPRPGTGGGRPSSSSSNSATSFYPTPPTNLISSKSFYPSSLHYPRNYPSNGYDSSDGTTSPSASTAEPSPFYFAPPDARNSSSTSPPSSSSNNPRKRAFSGPDGPVHSSYDDLAAYSGASTTTANTTTATAPQQAPHHIEYDYGSESRPQSRRLSVMELCNDATGEYVDDGGFLVNGDRPPAAALGMGAMTMFERRRASPGSAQSHSGSGSGRSEEGQGRVSPPSRRVTPHGIEGMNGTTTTTNGYAHPPPPPPRPHSTAFSVSSASSASAGNSSPGYAAQGAQFGYHHHHHQQHQQPYTSLNLVGAMSSLHHHSHHPPPHPHAQQQQQQQQHQQHAHHQHPQHQGYTPSPAPTSAASFYSPRSSSSSFSPRSPGQMAHQQAQAFQALQQGGGGGAYAHAHAGQGQGAYAGGAYEYGGAYSA